MTKTGLFSRIIDGCDRFPFLITRHSSLITFVIIFAVFLTPAPAAAHGYLIRAIPEDRAALDRAPARVQYWFSEDLEPAFSRVTVRDQAGNTIAEGGVSDADRSLMTARLPLSLPDGAYIAELRTAFASDGHVVVETRVFFVGDAVSGVGGTSSDGGAVPLEVLWRTLLLVSTMLLFGTFALYSLVLVAAWGSPQHPIGWLPPRLMTHLNILVYFSLGVALAANVLALLQQTMVFFSAGLDRVLSDNLWTVVRIGTRFGDTWNARMLMLFLIGLIHGAGILYRRTQPELTRPGWVANAWAGALLLGTWSIASHAAGSQVFPWLALLSDWLHGVAVGMWAGGLAALTLILPTALQPYQGDTRRLALLAALRRFSRLALVGLVIVVTTGIYNALNWLVTPSDISTGYGGTLLVKLVLVAALIAVGAAHRIALDPDRYRRWAALLSPQSSVLSPSFSSLRLETVLALAVLTAAAWLSATPPPFPPIDAPSPLRFTTELGKQSISLAISPGGVGVNTYDVQVSQGDGADNRADVAIRFADPTRDFRSVWHVGEPIEDGTYTASGADIDRLGEWWVVISVDGAQTAFDFTVTADAQISRSRPLTALHILALAAVMMAIGYALLPLARRLNEKIDWNPTTVTAAVLAAIGGIAVVVVGLLATAATFEDFSLTIAPPPAIVNPVLPTSEALERGKAAFEVTCPAWQDSLDLQELVKRLPRTRDEDLYNALTQDGWSSLAPCAGGVDNQTVWEMANYVRSMGLPDLQTKNS